MASLFEFWGDLFYKRGLLKQGRRLAGFPFVMNRLVRAIPEKDVFGLSENLSNSGEAYCSDGLIILKDAEITESLHSTTCQKGEPS